MHHQTKDWQPSNNAKILLIGHDPRLQKSDTIAEYALFANYYINNINITSADKSKYKLAKSVFDSLFFLTNGKYKANEIYITNLYNGKLPHASKNKTVLIPPDKIKQEIERLKAIVIDNPTIEYIFPMSQQVNYWLQKFNFYEPEPKFLKRSEPKIHGINEDPPYFEPRKPVAFKIICGKKYKYNYGPQIVIPILHVKHFPLKGNFLRAYDECYAKIRNYFV